MTANDTTAKITESYRKTDSKLIKSRNNDSNTMKKTNYNPKISEKRNTQTIYKTNIMNNEKTKSIHKELSGNNKPNSHKWSLIGIGKLNYTRNGVITKSYGQEAKKVVKKSNKTNTRLRNGYANSLIQPNFTMNNKS